MNEQQLIILWSCLALVIGGALFFFLAGLYVIKKDQVAIIEKLGAYNKTLKQGIHWLLPTVYRCVRKYQITPLVQAIQIENGPKLDLTYQIVDEVAFYYSEKNLEQYLNTIRKENSELTVAVLVDEFNKIGIRYISLARSKND